MTMVPNTSPEAGAKQNRQQRRHAARLAKKGRRGNDATVSVDAALIEAVKLHKAGRPHEALQIYLKILAIQPDQADALNLGGVASFQSGQNAEAVQMLQRAVALRPGDAEIHTNLGNVLQASGGLDRAMAAYRRAIEIKPDHAEAYYNLGLLLQRDGKVEQAAAAYRRAIEIKPDYAEAHNNLGTILKASGQIDGAIAAYRRAVEIKSSFAEGHNNLGEILRNFGEIGEAVAACRRAVEIKPDYAEGFNNLGIALRALGKHNKAVAAVRRAIEIKPDFAVAHFNLGHFLYCEASTEASALALSDALRADPNLLLAHFFLGVIREQQGNAEADHFARLADNPKESRHLVDSWNYAKSRRTAATRFHGDSFETLEFALGHAQVEGLVLEFGVRFGNSIDFTAQHAPGLVHGFDSFQGLPEDWEGLQSGAYTTGGKMPDVAPNVRLHAGWFDNTLPQFAAEHPGPVRFMNVDCDLYSSTKTIFEHLADRIVPGTVIVFDEYFMNPHWREDEYKAFQEAVRENSWRYEYIAFNLFSKQAAVRII